jgi:uncharacterized membrane protein YkoI
MRFLAAATAIVAAVTVAQAQASTSNAAKPRITMKEAGQTALTKEKGTMKSFELEKERGRLIYSFGVQATDRIHEVNVDAMNGKVVEDTIKNAPQMRPRRPGRGKG